MYDNAHSVPVLETCSFRIQFLCLSPVAQNSVRVLMEEMQYEYVSILNNPLAAVLGRRRDTDHLVGV